MLARAIADAAGHTGKRRSVGYERGVAQRAKHWLFEDKTISPKYHFSYLWICDQLDLCADTTRTRIKRLLDDLGTKGQQTGIFNMTSWDKLIEILNDEGCVLSSVKVTQE